MIDIAPEARLLRFTFFSTTKVNFATSHDQMPARKSISKTETDNSTGNAIFKYRNNMVESCLSITKIYQNTSLSSFVQRRN